MVVPVVRDCVRDCGDSERLAVAHRADHQSHNLWLHSGNRGAILSSLLVMLRWSAWPYLLSSQVWLVLLDSENNVISPRCPALYWSCSVCRPAAAENLRETTSGDTTPVTSVRNVIKHAILSSPLTTLADPGQWAHVDMRYEKIYRVKLEYFTIGEL